LFRYRFFGVALWLLGSVLLHLLLLAWGLWRMMQPEPELMPPKPETVSIGLLKPEPSPQTSANVRSIPSRSAQQAVPRSVVRDESVVTATPPDQGLPDLSSQPTPESISSADSAAVGMAADDVNLTSLSPEVLSEEVLEKVWNEPLEAGEISLTQAPASAYLHYKVSLQRAGERLSGSGYLQWQWQPDQYRIEITAHAILQVSKQISAGRWQANHGLVPEIYSDQRGWRSENRVIFERQGQAPQLYYSASNSRLPLQPGTQDYASLILQLSSLLASQAAQLHPGLTIRFPVTDARKSREMIFQLREPEIIETSLGRFPVWCFSYQPAAGANERNIDIWFARDVDWLPVRLRFADPGRDEILEFNLQRREAL
jgi:hypothetical protein